MIKNSVEIRRYSRVSYLLSSLREMFQCKKKLYNHIYIYIYIYICNQDVISVVLPLFDEQNHVAISKYIY